MCIRFFSLCVLFSLAFSDESAKVSIESSTEGFDGKGVIYLHNGGPVKGAIVGDKHVEYTYNSTANGIYANRTIDGHDEDTRQYLVQQGERLNFGENGDSVATVNDDDYLSINGSDSMFYACPPYENLRSKYVSKEKGGKLIGIYESNAPDGCESIKIHVDLSSNSTDKDSAQGSTETSKETSSATDGASTSGSTSTKSSTSTMASASSSNAAEELAVEGAAAILAAVAFFI